MKEIILLISVFIMACKAQAAPSSVTLCDTLFNLVSVKDTPSVLPLNASDTGGYYAGNNSYGDIAKAEEFKGAVGGTVSGAYLSFGHVSINADSADSNMVVKAYLWPDASGPGGAIDSATITLKAIATEVAASNLAGSPQYIYVPFTSGASLPTDIFYVGVVLPSTLGDTIAFYTNGHNNGFDGAGWQEYGDSTWHRYGHGLGNYIKAAICATGGVPVAAFSSQPVCSGEDVQLTDMSTNTPYQWNWTITGGNPAISTSQNPTSLYVTAGTYSITLIATNFFGADTVTQNLTVYQTPGDSIISLTPASNLSTANGSVTITGTLGTPPYTYLWAVDHDSTATLSNVVPAFYLVTVTDSHGCYAAYTVAVTDVTGINEIGGNNQVKIYPNPAGQQLNIQWSITPDAEISVVNMNGQILKKFIANGGLLNTFDIHDLSAGAYIIRITDRVTNQQQSVVFEKL